MESRHGRHVRQGESKYYCKILHYHSRKAARIYSMTSLFNFCCCFFQLRQKFSEVYGVPIGEIKFVFDGEVVMDSDTPTTLDMEQDNMIDAKVCETLLSQYPAIRFCYFESILASFQFCHLLSFDRLTSPCMWMLQLV